MLFQHVGAHVAKLAGTIQLVTLGSGPYLGRLLGWILGVPAVTRIRMMLGLVAGDRLSNWLAMPVVAARVAIISRFLTALTTALGGRMAPPSRSLVGRCAQRFDLRKEPLEHFRVSPDVIQQHLLVLGILRVLGRRRNGRLSASITARVAAARGSSRCERPTPAGL